MEIDSVQLTGMQGISEDVLLAQKALLESSLKGFQGQVVVAADLTALLKKRGKSTTLADAPLVAIYVRCIDHVADALAQGTPPAAALTDWIAAAQDLSKLISQRRRTSFLIDHAAVVQTPGAFVKTFGTRFGLPVQRLTAEVSPDTPAVDPVLAVIAAWAMTLSPVATQLEAELESSAVPLGGADTGQLAGQLADPARAFEDYSALSSQLAQMVAEQAKAPESDRLTRPDPQQISALLGDQMRQLRHELETYSNENQGLRDAVWDRDVELGVLRQREADLDAQLRETTEYVGLLINSTSWRLTRPMRALRHAFRPRRPDDRG